jgi:hypothetical protein
VSDRPREAVPRNVAVLGLVSLLTDASSEAIYLVIGLATLPASVMAGLLWDNVSHATPFWASAALMVLAALGLTAVKALSATDRLTAGTG